ncbi:MAG: alkaline phosphatase family protein [Acidimicrobiales bacterium]
MEDAPAGGQGPPAAPEPEPVLPAYGGACLSGVVPALLGRHRRDAPAWLPGPARQARQVVLLVFDGLGWDQLDAHRDLMPVLGAMAGGPITSVVPTTTATALTSITTGTAPAEHGVVGYRVVVPGDQVLNVLRWRAGGSDARKQVRPTSFQALPAFCGTAAPVVTRAELAGSGFTAAHLGGARLRGWRMPSSLVVEVSRLLEKGEPFVYAYYDGVDKVAHEWGLGAHYRAELGYADRLVADVQAALPAGAALVVTADHGQVEVGDSVVSLPDDLLADVAFQSGEGRFRWLHARAGAGERLAARAREACGGIAWVRTRAELVADGWYGGPLRPEVAARLGDVALVPYAPVAFPDPADTGELKLVSRHGSLTRAEMLVPLLASAR